MTMPPARHKNLYACTDDQLEALGYWRDEVGIVRETASGFLVCGYSGRFHRYYLRALPDYTPPIDAESGAVDTSREGVYLRAWVDDEVMRSLPQRLAHDGLAPTVSHALRQWIGDALAGGIRRILQG